MVVVVVFKDQCPLIVSTSLKLAVNTHQFNGQPDELGLAPLPAVQTRISMHETFKSLLLASEVCEGPSTVVVGYKKK
jgi:hypothetical protein